MQGPGIWACRLLRDRPGAKAGPAPARLWLAYAAEAAALIACIATALLVLTSAALIVAATIGPMLTLDLLAPTAAQVLDPEFSLEGTMAHAQETR